MKITDNPIIVLPCPGCNDRKKRNIKLLKYDYDYGPEPSMEIIRKTGRAQCNDCKCTYDFRIVNGTIFDLEIVGNE